MGFPHLGLDLFFQLFQTAPCCFHQVTSKATLLSSCLRDLPKLSTEGHKVWPTERGTWSLELVVLGTWAFTGPHAARLEADLLTTRTCSRSGSCPVYQLALLKHRSATLGRFSPDTQIVIQSFQSANVINQTIGFIKL